MKGAHLYKAPLWIRVAIQLPKRPNTSFDRWAATKFLERHDAWWWQSQYGGVAIVTALMYANGHRIEQAA